ncbi:hypothetical protein AOLI_G00244530 [Acnodon oligacanthus]
MAVSTVSSTNRGVSVAGDEGSGSGSGSGCTEGCTTEFDFVATEAPVVEADRSDPQPAADTAGHRGNTPPPPWLVAAIAGAGLLVLMQQICLCVHRRNLAAIDDTSAVFNPPCTTLAGV